ncbi:hypothetical protein AGR4B_Cc60493 [Agrobacterium tumefaciens str. CFBP 5621]|nr:hypothetical protein AGR4B_Cc60493 [Agrobacterium tumefaciens str. CFBP 5621]
MTTNAAIVRLMIRRVNFSLRDREKRFKSKYAQIKCLELPRSVSAGTNQSREIITPRRSFI